MVLQLLKGACRHVASRIRGRKKDGNGERKRISNTASPLLNSPVEVVLLIAEQMTPTERLFLSQTCSDLRAIIGPSSPLAVQKALDTNRSEFLTVAHKILPRHRFCDRCNKLHAAKTFDVPTSPWKDPKCPRSKEHLRRYFGYRLARRHVQLAMKYHALGKPCATRLEALMRGYKTRDLGPLNNAAIYTFKPKISQGKFLLMSRYELDLPIRLKDRSLDRKWFRTIRICPHIMMRYEQEAWFWTNNIYPRAIGCVHDARDPTVLGPQSPLASQSASCEYCPTDYNVMASRSVVTITTWQDMGTGSIGEDRAWDSHVSSFCEGEMRTTKYPFLPGSVRRSYEALSSKELISGNK